MESELDCIVATMFKKKSSITTFVVCPNCKMGHQVNIDMKTDRPQTGISCKRCMKKITWVFHRKTSKETLNYAKSRLIVISNNGNF